jgi:hypothetical protein
MRVLWDKIDSFGFAMCQRLRWAKPNIPIVCWKKNKKM